MAFYEPSKYAVTVLEQAFGESKEKRTPQLVLKVRVDAKVVEYGGGDSGELQIGHERLSANYERQLFVYLTENTIDNVVKKLRHAGFDGDNLNDLNLVGRQIEAFCNWENYQGKDREKWDLALPPFESRPLDHSPDVVRKANALFSRAARSSPASSARPAARPAPVAVGARTGRTGADDDIPF